MELTETLRLPAEPADVWKLLSDVVCVSQCIPGAELGADLGNDTYEGSITFVLGPKRILFSGRVVFENKDDELRGNLMATGADASGSTRATGHVEYSVADTGDAGGGSLLTLVSRVNFLGPLAGFVETGGIHVGRRILAEFGTCLSERLAAESSQNAGPARSKPLKAVPLAIGAIWWNVRELVGRLRRARARPSKRD